jgi:hypothetical protein
MALVIDRNRTYTGCAGIDSDHSHRG